jgi:hypothetical protein
VRKPRRHLCSARGRCFIGFDSMRVRGGIEGGSSRFRCSSCLLRRRRAAYLCLCLCLCLCHAFFHRRVPNLRSQMTARARRPHPPTHTHTHIHIDIHIHSHRHSMSGVLIRNLSTRHRPPDTTRVSCRILAKGLGFGVWGGNLEKGGEGGPEEARLGDLVAEEVWGHVLELAAKKAHEFRDEVHVLLRTCRRLQTLRLKAVGTATQECNCLLPKLQALQRRHHQEENEGQLHLCRRRGNGGGGWGGRRGVCGGECGWRQARRRKETGTKR